MLVWNFFLFSSLITVSQASGAEVILPLSGTFTGEQAELFTMLTTAPQGTRYIIRSDLTLCDFSGLHIHENGGAFRNLEGGLSLIGTTPLARLTFKHLNHGAAGAGIFSRYLLNFENLRNILAEDNSSYGGVVASHHDIAFVRNYQITCQNNISHGCGGAVYLNSTQPARIMFAEQRGPITFVNNSAKSQDFCQDSGHGGAIACDSPGATILFDQNQDIVFENNQASLGGCIYNKQGSIEFANNRGSVLFQDNHASHSGGALYALSCDIHRQTSKVNFFRNKARNFGGAIYAQSVTIKHNDDLVHFFGNSAEGGGAIATTSCRILATQPVKFSMNWANGPHGGAILLYGSQPRLYLQAQNGDIIFENNYTTINSIDPYFDRSRYNAIFIEESPKEIHFIANENQSIIFYDPVVALSGSSSPVHINSSECSSHSGSIIFSGIRLSEKERMCSENHTSIFNQPLYLHNGVLSLEGRSVLAVQEFHQYGGTFAISPGCMLTSYNSSGKDLVINNLSFGLDPVYHFFSSEIHSKGESAIRLSGSPKIHDPQGVFYNSHDLAARPYNMEICFRSDKGVITTEFIPQDIAIQQNNYGYQGRWHFNWSEDSSNTRKVLKASWTPTGEFILNPKRSGRLIPSSLWGTFSGLQSANDAILDTYLNDNTLVPINHASIFSTAISSCMQQNSAHSDAFSTTHAGNNLGVRLPFSSNTVVCAAFTQLYGSNAQEKHTGKSHSHTLLGTLAATKNWQSLSFRSSVSYVEETHTIKSITSQKISTRGSWKNQGWRGTLGFAYAYPRALRCLKITPFINVEYTVLIQNPFIETGYDPRYFGSSNLSNLALPAGIALELRCFGDHYSLFTQLSMAYIKDFQRENPITSASLILNQHAWKVSSVPMGQEAVSLKLRSTLRYRFASVFLGISSTQREGNNLSGDAFTGLSLRF
ncbi:autotransporter beta-domain protein [Chlamydia ibidis 10-1398/6]|nr:autotransporter beta-domain protein [Chlamydia ibidis 10-1398/6]